LRQLIGIQEEEKKIAKCIARRADDNDRCRNYRQMEKGGRATEEAAGCGLWADETLARRRQRVKGAWAGDKKRGKITEVRVQSARGRKERRRREEKKEKKERRKGG
jgi:hypothetical protein